MGINRPEKRNCVNSATAAELVDAIQDFDNDDSVNAIVLHGIGGSFCAGYDLKELSEASDVENILTLNRAPMVKLNVNIFKLIL